MYDIILDTNIYDLIEKDVEIQNAIEELNQKKKINVLVTPDIWQELLNSYHKGVPKFFPVEYVSRTVIIFGISCFGDRFGKGEIYHKMLNSSVKNSNDAMIADVASFDADILVTEDKKFRKKFSKISTRCKAMNFVEFEKWIEELEGVQ